VLAAWHCEKTSRLHQDNGVQQSITGLILCVIIIIPYYYCTLVLRILNEYLVAIHRERTFWVGGGDSVHHKSEPMTGHMSLR